jgi:hypothetical protein
MALIVLLFIMSVYGAFIGPERAAEFFNSIPLAVYWLGFILLLALGIVFFQRLRRIPALLMIHLGCIAILAGGIWGSQAGHELQSRRFGIDKISTGTMQIFENSSDNRVILPDNQIKQLPFSIALKDFRIEYYQPQYLYIQSKHGDVWDLPVEVGTEYQLGNSFGSVKIIRKFENFKIGDNRTITDDPNTGSNPALEVRLIDSEGKELTRYVFEPARPFMYPNDNLYMIYNRSISDYISDLQVIQDGKIVAEKDIEVNHPLHFGGYHFYQQSYDTETGQYTILRVVSDTGLRAVYFGFILLCVGVVLHFWLKKITAWSKEPIREKAKNL